MIYQYIFDLIDKGLIKSGRALDIGCGDGGATNVLLNHGFVIDAVDIQQQDAVVRMGRGVSFVRADIRDYKIEKNSYDFIHARNVLHFLSRTEMKSCIAKMFAGLKNGGVMYFTVSGDKDGWTEKSKDTVTFLSEDDLARYIESGLEMPVYNKVTRLGYSTTTKGILKYTHTIAYTVVRSISSP